MQPEPINATTPITTSAGTAKPVTISQDGQAENMMFRDGPPSRITTMQHEYVNTTLQTAAAWASIASALLLVAILVVVVKMHALQSQSKK